MGLKDILQQHKIPLPSDFDERMEVVQAALRNSPDFDAKLKAFKEKKTGGAIPIPVMPDSMDFLGPQLRWFVQVLGSPYAQGVVRSLFMIIFFVSYLESIPLFGSILSAGLDVMVAGGKSLTKTIQTNIPPLVGLIPLPFMSLVGLMIASVFGLIMWPIFAMVSFSRQDFAVAIESSLRMIPPPIGNTIADLFMEANRMVARIDAKRRKLADDIVKGIKTFTDAMSSVSGQFKDKAKTFATKTKEVATKGIETTRDIINKQPSIPKMPTMPTVPTMPNLPSMPNLPKAPTMPTVPNLPTMPTVPNLPTMPTMPTVPNLPTMPTVPKVPTIGGKRFSRYSTGKNKTYRWQTKRKQTK